MFHTSWVGWKRICTPNPDADCKIIRRKQGNGFKHCKGLCGWRHSGNHGNQAQPELKCPQKGGRQDGSGDHPDCLWAGAGRKMPLDATPSWKAGPPGARRACRTGNHPTCIKKTNSAPTWMNTGASRQRKTLILSCAWKTSWMSMKSHMMPNPCNLHGWKAISDAWGPSGAAPGASWRHTKNGFRICPQGNLKHLHFCWAAVRMAPCQCTGTSHGRRLGLWNKRPVDRMLSR